MSALQDALIEKEYVERLKRYDEESIQEKTGKTFTEFQNEQLVELFQEHRLNRWLGSLVGASYMAMLQEGYRLVRD